MRKVNNKRIRQNSNPSEQESNAPVSSPTKSRGGQAYTPPPFDCKDALKNLNGDKQAPPGSPKVSVDTLGKDISSSR